MKTLRTTLHVILLFLSSVSVATEAAPVLNSLVQGNNEFAIDLYKNLASAEKGNVFYSPYSISSALAMTFAGAGGETAQQMAQVLRFPEPTGLLQETFGELTSSINSAGNTGSVKISVANALWGQKGLEFKSDFLALTQRYYGAGLHEMDFTADAAGARNIINAWVEKNTQDKIKNLIAPGVLDKATRLVLTNAIYFKGNWVSKFKKDSTKDQPFHLGAGGETNVPLMNQTAEFGYMETAELQGLELPYAGKRLSMVVLLPEDVSGLQALESQLSEKDLAGWLSKMVPRKVIVYLPKFKTTSQFKLNSALESLGMKDAFKKPSKDPQLGEADFSGMDGKRNLYISAAIHKAFVDVDESGTEAAAATAVVVMRSMAVSRQPPPPVFRADHPFLFLIRDKNSGSILFLGRYSDPQS